MISDSTNTFNSPLTRLVLIKFGLRSSFVHAIAITSVISIAFFLLAIARNDISFDYIAYYYFFESLNDLTFEELLTDRFTFPYIITNGLTSFEFGFAVISKIFTSIFIKPELTYAAMASLSIGLRVHIMRKLMAPWFWIIIVNIYAITLFEANALRLGLASSLIIYGLYTYAQNKKLKAYLIILSSVAIHLQVLIFLVPLYFSWVTKNLIQISKFAKIFVLTCFGFSALAFAELIPSIENTKILEYLNRGQSGSSGVTLTSVLAILFIIISFLSLKKKNNNINHQIWGSILLSSFFSSILLLTLTNIAVIGDRSWQLSFVILSTFMCCNRESMENRIIPSIILYILSLVSVLNITLRHPLSNFFYPIFPEADIFNGF